MPLKWAAIIGYMSAKGGPFYSNDVIWLHQVTVPLHQGTVPLFWVHQIHRNTIQNRISSETYNWDVHATWEIEPKNLGFTQMTSHGGVECQNILLILASMCFLWNNLWSVCRYITRPITGCSSQDRPVNNILTAPIWKCMSGIGDYRFTFLVDLFSNYTFYTNLTIFSIRILLIEDVTSLIVFNIWKVEKIMQHRLMPV